MRPLALTLVLVALASACAPVATTAPDGACVALRDAVADDLGVPVAARAPTAGACRLDLEAEATRLGSFVDVATRLRSLLLERGWRQDPAFAADGPAGTRAGYRRDGALAVVAVDWRTDPPGLCPDDRPLVECEVPADAQRIAATILVEADAGRAP